MRPADAVPYRALLLARTSVAALAVSTRALNHDSVAVEFPIARRAGGARQEIAG